MLKKEYLNILVGTNHLDRTGGTESFTYSLIKALIELSHNVEYFTFSKGVISNLIEKELNVSFKTKNKYDLILANHNTIVKKLHKYGYIIQTCHGIYPELEQPSPFADYYVAISEEVQQYLLSKGYFSSLIRNGIDCSTFKPERPLNKTPIKILSLCQSVKAHEVVESACKALKIDFLRADKFIDNTLSVPKLINQADIVVGLGRSAYEAMACGRPVIVFDNRSYINKNLGDGYLPDNLALSVNYNCSGRALNKIFEVNDLILEIARYDLNHGQVVLQYAQTQLNSKIQAQKYINLFNQISNVHFINAQTRFWLKKRINKEIRYKLINPFSSIF